MAAKKPGANNGQNKDTLFETFVWFEVFGNLGSSENDREAESILKEIRRTESGIREIEKKWNVEENDSKYAKDRLIRMKRKLKGIRQGVWDIQNAEEALPETARVMNFLRPLKPMFFDRRGALVGMAAYSTWQLKFAHIVVIIVFTVIAKWLCFDWNPQHDNVSKIWKKEALLARARKAVKDIDEHELKGLETMIKNQREADNYAVRVKINKINKAYEASGGSQEKYRKGFDKTALAWTQLKTHLERGERRQDRTKNENKDGQTLTVREYQLQFQKMTAEILDFWCGNIGGQKSEMKVSRVVEMVLSNYKGASKEKFENQQEREKITAFYTMLLDPNQDGAVSIEEFISFMQYFGPLDKCVDKIAAVKDEDWFMWVNTATGDIDDPFGESVDGRQDVVGTFGIRQSRQVGCFTYMVKLPDGKGSYYIEKIRIINDPGSDTKPSDGKDAVHREGGKYYWLMSAPIGSAAKYLQMSAANLKHAKDLIEKQLRSRYREQRFQFVPYKDLNMDVVMQVGGETFVYKLKVFLNENFRNTRLHTYFSNYKNCKRGMVHRFDEDPEIFRRVIRYYLHVTEPDAVIPSAAKSRYDQKLADKAFQEWIPISGSDDDEDEDDGEGAEDRYDDAPEEDPMYHPSVSGEDKLPSSNVDPDVPMNQPPQDDHIPGDLPAYVEPIQGDDEDEL